MPLLLYILQKDQIQFRILNAFGRVGRFFAQHRLRRADQQYKGLVGQAAAGKEGLLTRLLSDERIGDIQLYLSLLRDNRRKIRRT